MSPIKDFTLTYEAFNPEGFSEGDTITGTVTLILTKDTKVKSIFVKAKGDASVRWLEVNANGWQFHRAHRRCFKVKEYLVKEAAKGTVLPQGVNHFKFSLTFPLMDMPSSFKGPHGKIVYMLKAKVSRSSGQPSQVQRKIMFISKSLLHLNQVELNGSVYKEMGIFSKTKVKMFVTVDRRIYSPGDTVSVVVNIHNSTSKKMKPKFILQQKTRYSTRISVKTCVKHLCKMVGDTITPKSQQTVSCQLKIPDDAFHTVTNCELISVECYLKVYLDISFATDPEVVFPLVISPFSSVRAEAVETYPAGASGGLSESDFSPSALPAENHTWT
ncbi:arrestin domain-containing protein 3-like [Paralichthys olivaceus]|uniref:arrestin domain-containing protein 3-like n=1 Tax=Paralichthys olivaceus TaxID=8255 RepID=UPI00097D6824|nr:PREDICTED: arrestin domain-containing protein 3-like [Paralichthys olivaceus]